MPTAEKIRTTQPAPTDTTSKKESWFDWFPSERVEDGITLDELLEELADAGMAHVSAGTLNFWQKNGILPYPVRRRRDGATRAIYPRQAVEVIQELNITQDSGFPLQEIGPRLRGNAALLHYANPDSFRDQITAIADQYGQITGRKVRVVEIKLTDVDGREDLHTFVTHIQCIQ